MVPVKHNRMKTNTRIHSARCPNQIQIHLGHLPVKIQINTYISNKQQRKQTLVVALKDHNKLRNRSDKCWCLGLDLSTSHPATSIRKNWGIYKRMTLEMAWRTRPLQLVLSGGPVTHTPTIEYNGLRGENRGPFKSQQASASNPVMGSWLVQQPIADRTDPGFGQTAKLGKRYPKTGLSEERALFNGLYFS